MDGRRLTLRLAGINNQNFLMRDDETGSWWQQADGRALFGPLRGRRLTPVFHEQVAFGVWKREHPEGKVLRPDPRYAARYAPANWVEEIRELPLVTPVDFADPLAPRDLVAGLAVDGAARAYPLARLGTAPLHDRVGGAPVILLAAGDSVSYRAFDARLGGSEVELFALPGSDPPRWVDAATGSEWDFAGRATSGPLAGARLAPLQLLVEFWFDWKLYHPEGDVYQTPLAEAACPAG